MRFGFILIIIYMQTAHTAVKNYGQVTQQNNEYPNLNWKVTMAETAQLIWDVSN